MGRHIIRWPLALGGAAAIAVTAAAASFALLGDATHEDPGAPSPATAFHTRPPESFLAAEARASLARPAAPDAPGLKEALIAADMLNLAGRLTHQPPAALTALAATAPPATLQQALIAADELNQAGVMDVTTGPPLIDVLHAATILADAGVIEIPPSPSAAASAAGRAPEPEPTLEPPPPPPPAPEVPTPPPAAPPPPTPEPTPPVIAAGWPDADFATAVLDSVNALRANAGLSPLTAEPRLTVAATSYAQMLAENDWFDHVGPDGSTLVDRIVNAGFPFDVQVGEVIAWGQDDWPSAGIAQAWLDSPPHRDQILEPVYSRAGIGCFFTQSSGRLEVRCVMDLAG